MVRFGPGSGDTPRRPRGEKGMADEMMADPHPKKDGACFHLSG
jgi:hypothetical protein